MTGVWLIRQNRNNIDNGKVPFFFFLIPCGTNMFVFKQLDLIILCHLNHLVLS